MSMDTFDEDLGPIRPPRKQLSGKKLVLFVILPVLLVIAAASGLYLSGALQPLSVMDKEIITQSFVCKNTKDEVLINLDHIKVDYLTTYGMNTEVILRYKENDKIVDEKIYVKGDVVCTYKTFYNTSN